MSGSPLFVYGSLKRGFRNHSVIADLEFLGGASTAPGYRLVLRGDYPALVAGGRGAVQGELYRVEPRHWPALDLFEGCPELYQRGQIELDDASRAWAYLIRPQQARDASEISGGIWREESTGSS